ncbi:MAG TPA: hypothetical protein VMJ75_13480 [Candidatus Acidoferrales bacterium]|nr:hypothetical protein [Candidatus Acidoferrales bacterium]
MFASHALSMIAWWLNTEYAWTVAHANSNPTARAIVLFMASE